MTKTFDTIKIAMNVQGMPFSPTRESIREFCEASLDFNPLHLDDEYTQGNFGKTNFGGIIMHGMNNFGIINKMLTDWLYPLGGIHRRLETRWKVPVKPGDTIIPSAIVTAIKKTRKSQWANLDVKVTNQRGETVAVGEAMVELPDMA